MATGSGTHTQPASQSTNPPPNPGRPGAVSSGRRQKGCIQVGFYDIDKTIGKGNFATVKLAKHRVTKSRIALKIINKSQLDESDLKKTYREISILKRLSHVNIVRLYQVMETKNMLYLATEHAPNGELFEFLAQNGRMEEPEAQRVFWQILLAVEYCHKQGVVHRDLKVENLLFDTYWDIKIADFGFSNSYFPDRLLDTWCGSPPYAAPEIFQGLNYNGERLDIWSMGVILYVLVCGCLPFDGDSLQALRERVLSGKYRVPYFLSETCESLVRRILVVEPSKRYSVDQIKNHEWMLRDPEYDIYNGSLNVNRNESAPFDDNVLQAMSKLGLDRDKIMTSVNEKKYDNLYAIYYLLLDKVANCGPLNVMGKSTQCVSSFSASYDSASIASSTSLEHKNMEVDKVGLMRLKSCSPKGSIGTPSLDEGFSSDVSFDADQSIGKESSMELQMTPIKEDPETEHPPPQTYQRSVSTDSQVSLDFDTSLQANQFSLLRIPAQPLMQVIAESSQFHCSYDEVSGERMLVNLGGHSNFSSVESQNSEFSSNISLDTHLTQNKTQHLSPQVSLSRPPLVHQQRIGDCFQPGFLVCGRRASESNLCEHDDIETDPKGIKHQLPPYDIQALQHLEPPEQSLSPVTVTQFKTDTLQVTAVSSAPGSPQIPKRLTTQHHIQPPVQNANTYLLPPSNLAVTNPATALIATRQYNPKHVSWLKPHSFDESQTYTCGGASADTSGGGYFDDQLPKQHSFDVPTRLQHQSSTEDQSGDDLANSLSVEKSLKSRGRRMNESPYLMKQSSSLQRPKPRFQRQLTMRQQHLLERQSSISKYSNSPPRPHNPNAEDSNNDLPCLLQQMELRARSPSPIVPSNESYPGRNPSPTIPGSQNLRYAFPSQYYAAVPSPNLARLTRNVGGVRQLSGPIPSISFETPEGTLCYLDSQSNVETSANAVVATQLIDPCGAPLSVLPLSEVHTMQDMFSAMPPNRRHTTGAASFVSISPSNTVSALSSVSATVTQPHVQLQHNLEEFACQSHPGCNSSTNSSDSSNTTLDFSDSMHSGNSNSSSSNTPMEQ